MTPNDALTQNAEPCSGERAARRRPNKASDGFVYCAVIEGKYAKIGFATDPEARIEGLRFGGAIIPDGEDRAAIKLLGAARIAEKCWTLNLSVLKLRAYRTPAARPMPGVDRARMRPGCPCGKMTAKLAKIRGHVC